MTTGGPDERCYCSSTQLDPAVSREAGPEHYEPEELAEELADLDESQRHFAVPTGRMIPNPGCPIEGHLAPEIAVLCGNPADFLHITSSVEMFRKWEAVGLACPGCAELVHA